MTESSGLGRRLGSLAVAAAIVFLLFWTMQHMVRVTPQGIGEEPTTVDQVEVVEVEPEDESSGDPLEAADLPPPPAAPPALARPDMPTVNVPTVSAIPDAGPIAVPAATVSGLGVSGLNLSGSGAFGGFGRGGGGGGGSGGGYGKGEGFVGKPLIPLSTARPQMPDWACKQKLRGWVEVVFTVMPNGRVTDVKLVDADPRGVFEVAAIESISNWIYAAHPKARQVKQRVPMDPEDCVYNWQP
jgi:protein TonB